MSMSLREQLLAAGLGTKKQAKQAEQQERQQHKQKHSAPAVDQRQQAAERARAAKLARDQELNRQRQVAAEQRARAAELKQLVEQHRIQKSDGYEYFNFVHKDKVRRIPADAALRERITSGELTIVRCEGHYELVPAAIGERIRDRNERAVVNLNAAEPSTTADNDDPYKDFVVPDDLRW